MGGARAFLSFIHSLHVAALMQLECYVLCSSYFDFFSLCWLDGFFVRRRGLPAQFLQNLVLGIFILSFIHKPHLLVFPSLSDGLTASIFAFLFPRGTDRRLVRVCMQNGRWCANLPISLTFLSWLCELSGLLGFYILARKKEKRDILNLQQQLYRVFVALLHVPLFSLFPWPALHAWKSDMDMQLVSEIVALKVQKSRGGCDSLYFHFSSRVRLPALLFDSKTATPAEPSV